MVGGAGELAGRAESATRRAVLRPLFPLLMGEVASAGGAPLRHRVEPGTAAWAATTDPPERHPRPAQRTMDFQRVDGVCGARGKVAARRRPSGEHPPVPANTQQQHAGRPGDTLHGRLCRRAHRSPPAAMVCRPIRLVMSATASESSPHVHFSAEAATRTRTSPAGMDPALAAKACRRRRRTVFR